MKIILNSLWGKFGQRGNMKQSKICYDPKDFYSLLTNPRLEITDMFQCPKNKGVMELYYREIESTSKEPPNTNVYIACFTTCHARLKLYDVLSTLGDKVLYYDTDSVIYRHPKNTPTLTRGDYLGELTNELNDDDRYITEFVSTGPKSYCYRDNSNRVSCKFKGISKTLFNLEIIGLETMLECIQKGKVHNIEGAKNLVFQLDRFGNITTDYEMKIFRMVYDKRSIGADYYTYPWGY